VNDIQPENEEVKKTYYRNYGVHPVEPLEPGGHTDYIMSFPSWEQTREALQDLPPDGNVITPECATTSGNPLTWTENPDLIHKRIDAVIEQTLGSQATLYLGTPYYVWSRSQQRSRWLNAVLAIKDGEIVSTTFKQNPLPAETMFLGIEKPETDNRKVLGGNAVLICNELFLHTKNPDDFVLKDKGVRQIFSPSLWPIPVKIPEDLDPDKVVDGDDEYYRKRLETYVEIGVFAVMKTVRRVIVSDQGRTSFPYPFPDLAPYNAVFDRIS
jgi:hypothetical protein